jgi:hypothetical protein
LRGPAGFEGAHPVVQHGGSYGCLRLGRLGLRGRGTSALHQLHELLTLLGLDGAELVLRVDAILAAQGEQILALHAQLTRQGKNPDLLVRQAELLW